MIECSNVTHFINETKILKNISFSWENSGLYTILGPNGAGKTTLLQGMGGISQFTQGAVFWNGCQIDSISVKEKSKIAAYLPQSFSVSHDMTVWEIIHFSRFPHMRFFRSLIKKEIEFGESLLKKFHLINLRHRNLNTLSGGELQKVHLICCLFQEPKILFLDEPLAYLDNYSQKEVCSFLKYWCCTNNAQVIMTSHNINLALLWSDKILALEQGQMRFVGTPESLAFSGVIEDMYRNSLAAIKRGEKTFFLPKSK